MHVAEATKPPATEAMVVLMAASDAVLASAEVPMLSVEPALNPYHPNCRIIVPTAMKGTLWGENSWQSWDIPPVPKRPMRGPRTQAPDKAPMPPVRWTTPDPAKSAKPREANHPLEFQHQHATQGYMKEVMMKLYKM
jgi:hypothetical protein